MAQAHHKFGLRISDLNSMVVLGGAIADVQLHKNELTLTTPQGDSHTVELNNKWHDVLSQLSPGTKANLVGGFPDNSTTLLIVDPDKMIDVTDVSECVSPMRDEWQLSLLKRFEPRVITPAMVRGISLNAAFDVLVANPDLSTSHVVSTVLRQRPLNFALLSSATLPDAAQAIEQELESILPHFRDIISEMGPQNITVEPQVISNVLGFQGRFDLLVKTSDGIRLIEMKSGKAPLQKKSGAVNNAVRTNHAAQVSTYAMMYDVMYPGKRSSAEVWYAAETTDAFRNVESVAAYAERTAIVRNMIVMADAAIAKRDFSALKTLTHRSVSSGSYASKFAHDFERGYAGSGGTCRTIAQVWLNFLATARQVAAENLAQTWQTTLSEKEKVPGTISDLKLDVESSDLNRMHLAFTRSVAITNTSLRSGDHVFLHHILEDGSSNPCAHPLLKATVRSVLSNAVMVSLRNKQVSESELLDNTWIIEQDVSESSLKQQYSSVFNFLNSDKSRQELIVGIRPPADDSLHALTISPSAKTPPAGVSKHQQELIETAANCKDYYLIQGPPGTGKTQVVLKGIVDLILSDPTQRILVASYTNRAANEICSALDKCGPRVNYLRHGSKQGTSGEQDSKSIPALGQTLSYRELRSTVISANCVVATIQSLHSSSEIWEFGEFTALIVDEASQVLEPALVGFLTRVDRWILIGDECQLPAVVAQPPSQLLLASDKLSGLGYTSTGKSYFERMRKLCKESGWTQAFGELSEQGRMHLDVMNIASEVFYGSRLRPILPWQSTTEVTPWHNILGGRSMFLNVQSTNGNQLEAEATLIVKLAIQLTEAIKDSELSFSLGIISPFRVQNHMIREMLPVSLRETVTIDTVERFQGSQRDIIFYGTAVSSQIDFDAIRSETVVDGQTIDRKLNVALTRARHQFLMVGNKEVLTTSASYAQVISQLLTHE